LLGKAKQRASADEREIKKLDTARIGGAHVILSLSLENQIGILKDSSPFI